MQFFAFWNIFLPIGLAGWPWATAAAADGFFAPQVAAAGAEGLGPLPSAGNSSSDCTSNAGVFLTAGFEIGEGVAVSAGVESKTGATGADELLFTRDDGGGCLRSSSSITSSTVT